MDGAEAKRMALEAPGALVRSLRGTAGGESGVLVSLALIVGAGAGLGAIGFRYLIRGFTGSSAATPTRARSGTSPTRTSPLLGPYRGPRRPGGRRTALRAAGLPLRARGPRPRRARGDARRAQQRRPDPRPGADRQVARLGDLCIGAGGSVGREGPIVQIGSAIGSVSGQLDPPRRARTLRLLVACGAAGGIAATFNAPIAGVFFALELILRDFQTRSFGLVVLSSVVATAVGRIAFGSAKPS